MSENAPMTPDQAVAELASGFPTRTPEYILDRAIHALQTLAAMAEEAEYRIVEKQAHAKLRAEVEKLRDRKRSLSKTQYQTARDLKNGIFDETFGTMPETHTVEAWEMGARSNQRTATELTRILEGEDG